MRTSTDQKLVSEFSKICACTNEEERIDKIIDFFHLPLKKILIDFRTNSAKMPDYEFVGLPSADSYTGVCAVIKDNSTGIVYTAKYENNPVLLKYNATHIKHRIIHMSCPNHVEREFTYSRFTDCQNPLHEEIQTIHQEKYRLTFIRKYPEAYPPYEQGDYISLSEILTGSSLFYEKILDYKWISPNCNQSSVRKAFVWENDFIFQNIMKELNE